MSDENNPAPRCPNCGNEGPRSGRSFCEVCGDFVDWDEVSRAERAARQPKPTPAPEPPAPSPAPAPAPDPAPAPAAASAPPPVPTTASFDDTPADSESKKSDLRRRARRLLVPLSGREEDEVVPPDQVVDAAVALAERIARNGPLALQATKELVRLAASDDAAARAKHDEWTATVFASNDAKEGATAFVEKRDPVWTGT